jgi:hypothetical protein
MAWLGYTMGMKSRVSRLSPTVSVFSMALAGVMVSATAAPKASACGGLFCSQISPTPVDQASERIIFQVNEDLSVTATVEIRYEGNPQDFSWIVPVSGTPDFVTVAEKDELQLFDLATAPRFIPPTVNGCGGGGGGFGCFASDFGSAVIDAAERDGVTVTEYPSVGPFDDIVVVEGGDPQALLNFLRTNDYQVTEGMEPFISDYTVEGYKFLATRLRADADVQDMVPIRFHCPQPNPEIPLRLTAIAAEPQMGFLVFVIAPRRYAPLNYAEVGIDVADIRLDQFNNNNYFALVSKRIDEAGGRGFVVESALTSADVLANMNGNVFLGTDTEQAGRESVTAMLADPTQIVTRFYGRMDGDEMIADPIFAPHPNENAPLTDGTLDLRTQVYDNCQAPTMPVCGALYCGDGDACAGSDLGDGCVCRNGHVARTINAPDGSITVACSSLIIDLHGGGTDACSGAQCGLGRCVPVNDRPACVCDEGAVAVVDRDLVTCVERTSPIFESDQILWPTVDLELGGGGCTSAVGAKNVGGAVSLALLFGSSVALRLKRRRRHR